jgi:heme-degrading monooxygenase HmoA
MICAMASSTARPGMESALVEAAQAHAKALEQQPGCHGTHVLIEPSTRGQVSISFFDTQAALQQALHATRGVFERHPLAELVEGEPTFRVFEVR